METLSYLIYPLMFTIVIEISIAFLCKIRSFRDLFVIFLTQVLTNPVVNLICFYIFSLENIYYYGLYLFVAETIVLFTETFIYKHCLAFSKINPFRLAYIGNLSSFGIGVLYVLIDCLFY